VQHVVPIAPEQDVEEPGTAVEQVVAAPAKQGIVPVLSEESVVLGPADDEVVAIATRIASLPDWPYTSTRLG
jgi:hypothetical protein